MKRNKSLSENREKEKAEEKVGFGSPSSLL
jgi:hypothetical protein